MKQKIILSSTFVLVGIVCAFVFVQAKAAVDDTTTKTRAEIQAEKRAEIGEKKEEIQERKEDRQQAREERIEQVCKNVEARIRTRISRYENNKKSNVNVFSNMVNRLNKLVGKFKALNLDTSKLESDIATLQDKISSLYEIHDTFISELKQTEDYACGKSEGEFKTKLGEARKVAPEVRSAIIEIREFYQTTIRPDILDLRSQLEDDTQESEESES